MRRNIAVGLVVIGTMATTGCYKKPSESIRTTTASTTSTAPTTPTPHPTTKTTTKPPPARAKLDPEKHRLSDWPKFLGPFGNSVSPEIGIISPWPKEGLREVWRMEADTGYAMPTISNGKLYLFDRIEDSARLRCFDAETGKYLWKFEYPTDFEDDFGYNNGPRCCPVIDGNRVYIYGPEGMLHCLAMPDQGATEPKLLWKVDTFKQFNIIKNFFGVGSTPVIEDKLLLVQVGGSPPGTPNDIAVARPNGSCLVAFDKLTGKVVYKTGDDLASYAVPVVTTIDGRRWCFVFARTGLLGLNPADGKVDFHYIWRARDLASVNASNPVVVGNQVFITECYGPGSALVKVKPGGHEVVWNDADKARNKSLQAHWNTPIHHEGYLYASSGRHTAQAELRCIEMATGKIIWKVPGLGRSSLTMIDGHFLCQTEEGTLILLKVNPEKYEEVSRMEFPKNPRKNYYVSYPCWAAPVVSHGLVFLLRAGDKLVCYELISKSE